MVTGSAALTEGVVKVDQVVDDTGGWNCGGYYARDIAAGGLGRHDVRSGPRGFERRLLLSAGVVVGLTSVCESMRLPLGSTRKSGIDLPGENEGNWPTNAWEMRAFGVPMEPSEACFLGIGQGAMQATPLQMANVASTVINGGTLYRPQIVREIRRSGRAARRELHAARDPARPGKARRRSPPFAREWRRVTQPGGTAYGLGIEGLPYSGKTGTVETAGGNGPNTTWFIAWAPTDRPSVALAVFVDRSGGYGATVAAPIARQILVKYFNKKP